MVFIVPSVLKPDLDLGLGQLQSPRQIRSFRARQVFLRRESSLQFVNLRVREGRPAPFLPALKVLPVILGLVHVLLSVLCNKNTKRQPPIISRRCYRLGRAGGRETSRWKQTRVTEGNPSELLQIRVQTNALDRERMIYRDHKSNVSTGTRR